MVFRLVLASGLYVWSSVWFLLQVCTCGLPFGSCFRSVRVVLCLVLASGLSVSSSLLASVYDQWD